MVLFLFEFEISRETFAKAAMLSALHYSHGWLIVA
jgi:hypothetical protein